MCVWMGPPWLLLWLPHLDPCLTDDLDCEVDLVLAHGVLHRDNIDTLVFLLCSLNGEYAAVLGGLHSDPALGLTQQLAGE